MKQFHTVVLERMKEVHEALDTEPYEAGWADEALLFVTIAGVTDSPARVTAFIQISADGINWADEGTHLGPIEEDGTSFVKITHFGGWLRARFEVADADPHPLVLTAQLALKG